VRPLAPSTRLNAVSRAGVALAGILWAASPLWAQSSPPVDPVALRQRATAGDVEAQNGLGNAYTNGTGGLPRDHAEALQWFRAAAEKGYAPAQYNLGVAYEQGRGVAADERQAFKYYLMSAEQGYAPGQFNVGNMYSAGRGVGQDYFEANLWLKQAADGGIAEAQFNLGLAYELGRGLKKDEAQAARWYRVAADRGYAPAQFNLALLLEEGRGVAKDPVAAAARYRAAAEQNFAPAQLNYGMFLAEGRPGVPAELVQGFVWLSRSVQNGGRPESRDIVAARLNPQQLAEANRLLAAAPPAKAVPVRDTPPAADGSAARVNELLQSLAQARDANSRLATENQRLEVENVRLTDQLVKSPGGDNSLVSQLREQNRRLAGQAEQLTADKESVERQVAVLTAEVNDLKKDAASTRASATSGNATAALERYETQVAALTRQLAEAASSARQLQTDNSRLAEANQRLEQAAASQPAGGGKSDDPAASSIITNLQRDNARLNDEVKRATRELLSLNQQVRTLRNAAATPGAASAPEAAGEVTRLTEQARQARGDVERLEADNKRLAARIAVLESLPKPVVDPAPAAAELENSPQVEDLKQRLAQAQVEKSDLEKWAASLETKVNEQAAAAKSVTDDQARKLAAAEGAAREAESRATQLEREIAPLRTAGSQGSEDVAKLRLDLSGSSKQVADLTAQVGQLTAERQQLRAQLKAAEGEGTDVARLRAAVADARAETADARAEATEARRELASLNQQTATGATDLEKLRRDLAGATTALEKSGATVAELTAANEKLGRDLAAARTGTTDSTTQRDELARARRDLAEMATLRQENITLREAAGASDELRRKNAELVRDNEQLTGFMNGNRRDLDQAQARVAELEKQLAEATTVRTAGGDEATRLRAELAEANRTTEKLDGTVAELTAANAKLEEDLRNAEKSSAAALAAQSQAVSAASPDSFRMEIGTLNERIKQLEAQMEDDRAAAAREVATLAGQLQRTRETNKSLTDANRALVAAKDSDTSATRDEVVQLQARIKELTAAGEESRRQLQQQSADLRSATVERDALRGQLVDARQVATVLPGLADEKAALQERLEAVGTQLVQAQRDEEELQKANATLTKQLAASEDATVQVRAELTALQGKIAAAETAADSHTTSVAELTAANGRLEQEREDMRRLVDSYRADIARLTQNVRTAEQQRTASERSGQQNIDALAAQLAQLRRELESARATQARAAEAFAAQERERSATIGQLRTENAALAARLGQAQGTLDQIAAAARLGTPAATIASGGPAPTARPSAPAGGAEVRYHTVVEGDSLSRISLRYYGTANRWQEIFQANRDVLQGSSALRVGQQLRIP
jgi:TPR repeat protein/chromosome segregation ATPase